MTVHAAAWTGMRPILSLPTSRVPPGNPRGWQLLRLAYLAARRKVKAVLVADRSHNLSADRLICAAWLPCRFLREAPEWGVLEDWVHGNRAMQR